MRISQLRRSTHTCSRRACARSTTGSIRGRDSVKLSRFCASRGACWRDRTCSSQARSDSSRRRAERGSKKERGMSRSGRHLFTSESVTEGHPDKIADQISDSILVAILTQDPVSRVACETLVTTGLAIVAGAIRTSAYVDFQEVVRATITEIGYNRGKFGFDAETCAVSSTIHSQSPDIAMGVDTGGAGDQGLMFGYACTETPELMPLPIMLAHKLCRGLSCARRDGVMDYLRPDGKSQVTVQYEGSRPVRVDAIVVSSQHSALVNSGTMREDVIEKI